MGRPIPAGVAGAARNGKSEAMHLLGKAAPMERLANALSAQLHAPVRDRTGLTGAYDFDVPFAGKSDLALPAPDGPLPPTLAEAIQAGLGLKLVKKEGSVEILVIDHVGKFIPN